MEETTAIVTTQKNGNALAAPIETAAAGVAAQEEAKIKARYALAVMHPRDIDTVRTRLLASCKRPGFAQSARYSLPRGGKKIEGPTIRFAEEVARAYGNLSVEAAIVHDDAERRVIRMTVTDVEANLPLSADVVIEKYVERNQLKPGQEALSARTNSQGRIVYRVPADEGELTVKAGALASKVRRNLILQVLPADILEEAMAACVKTVRDGVKADPEAERKKILDAFASVGVQPADLKAYVGTDLAHMTADTLVDLRSLYQSLKDGETTWPDVMASRDSEKKAESAPQTLDDMAKSRKAKKETAQAPAPDPDAPPPEHWEKIDKEGAK